MERSSAASLNYLHTEILQMICNYLWQDYNPRPWEKQVPNKALAALTATSRRMRSIAMPVLYNHPTGAISFGALIWILENRPEIRDYITYLELPDPLAWSSQHFEYLKGVARRLNMDIDGDEDFEKAKETEVSLKRFGAELLMALSPKVETMVLHIEAHGRDREDTSFSFLARRFKQLGAATHFKHLRELSLTFGQCPDGYGIDNLGVATILGAAPHLKTLMFERTYGLREWYRRLEVM
ncbi:hypothetical protein NM208_g7184 [Fusarium decemcellulare]|uniref:Uncharacterized protein n=1 Tax=Fusarium decemcellulare TaxID=57161 RepID=A0ACC1SAL6_9HYPO|nr:hypothetical protein NM208_g7184 [Fusarium decemcellulare]